MNDHRSRHHSVRRGIAALFAAALLLVAVACGDDAEDSATTRDPAETPPSTTVPAAAWEADAQAVLDGSIGPDGLRVVQGPEEVPNPAQGAVAGIRLADGTQHVLTAGTNIDGQPVDPDGTFPISFLTRTIVEMAAWELAEAGEIDLDAPIAEWAPQVPNAEAITLRMVFDRTDGLADADDAVELALFAEPNRSWTLADAVDVVAELPPAGPPGTFRSEVQEVGPGIVVGHVLEEATGRSLDDLVEEHVADPLELDSMAFAGGEDLASEGGTFLLPDAGIVGTDEPGLPIESFLTIARPAWGLKTDMGDLMTALGAVVEGEIPGPDQAPAPSAFPADRFVAERDIAFGLDTPLVAYCPCTGEGADRAYSSYGRSGATASTSATMVTFPDTGISMALRLNASSANGADMRRVLYEIHDLITAS